MTFNQSYQRWLAMTFPPTADDKKAERALAKLWKKLASEKPRWYHPVGDQMGPATGQALGRLRTALIEVATALELVPGAPVAPSFLPELIDRLADRFFEKSQLSRPMLTFEFIKGETSASRGGDLRGMQQLMQSRIQTLLKSEATRWQSALPTLEALVHLAAFDWTPLVGVLPRAKRKAAKALGQDYVDALEDLTFLLEPVNIDKILAQVWQVLTNSEGLVTLEALKEARTSLIAEGRLLDVIRAIHSDAAYPFKWAAYKPPTLSDVVKDLYGEFEMNLRQHQAQIEKIQLAKRLQDLFGARELSPFPVYNEETSALLISNRLPELRHAPAIKVLYNVRELFHKALLQTVFQQFQLEVDWVSPSAKEEFLAYQDDYFTLMDKIERFAEDYRSPSRSRLAPVFSTLQAPFVDNSLKLGLKKLLESVDGDADHLCQSGFRVVKGLHTLFEKYLLDLDAASPHCFLGGSVLLAKHPELVTKLRESAEVFKNWSGVLRQMVVDLEDSSAKIHERESR